MTKLLNGETGNGKRGNNDNWYFYDNCRNLRALIGQFLSSICGQTNEFEITATRQRARAGNSTICYRKKQNDVSF